MSKLFLSLDNAVAIAVREFGIDKTLARQEFEQKCYVSDKQYEIGFYDGVRESINTLLAIDRSISGEEQNERTRED